MKKVTTLLIGITTLSLVIATPAHAANPFSNFTSKLRDRFEELTLKLPGNKPGLKVLEESFEEMEDIKSFTFDMNAYVDLQAQGQSQAEVTLDVVGPIEVKEVYNPEETKQDFNIKGELTMQGTTLKADADMKMDGQTMYFKLNQIPALPLPIDINQLKGQWLKSEIESTQKTRTEVTEEQEEELRQAFIELMKQSEISEATKEEKDGNKVFVVTAVMPDEALLTYINKVVKVMQTDDAMSYDEATIKDALDQLDPIQIEMWVDRGSLYTTHTATQIVFKPEQKESLTAQQKATMGPLAMFSELDTIVVDITMDMKDFDKPINFEVPSDARDAEEVMQEIVQSQMQTNQ